MTMRGSRPNFDEPAGGTGSSGAGAEGIRTPDLLIATETRYQLRHSPRRVFGAPTSALSEKISPARPGPEPGCSARSLERRVQLPTARWPASGAASEPSTD